MEFLFSCFNYWNVPPTADGELIPNFRKQNPSYNVQAFPSEKTVNNKSKMLIRYF